MQTFLGIIGLIPMRISKNRMLVLETGSHKEGAAGSLTSIPGSELQANPASWKGKGGSKGCSQTMVSSRFPTTIIFQSYS